VAAKRRETHDSVTLRLDPLAVSLAPFRPGQFCMLYAHGIGEVAISISGDPAQQPGTLTHTIRDVGAVSHALCSTEVGTLVGARGPFGTDWRVREAAGRDLVVVAGGVGLAPLRPVVLAALGERARYGRVIVVVGARTPDEFLFTDQLTKWSADPGLELLQTVDRPAPEWRGQVGFVTDALMGVRLDAAATTAFVCGPEPMMRFSADLLADKGVAPDRIRISLERSMKCGAALCGHCQLGPLLVCRDGPVVDFGAVRDLLTVREL
jgi:NAD(P)H-flavin reductase